MSENNGVDELKKILEELEAMVQASRKEHAGENLTIKDLRRIFDQESSKLNQAIFNDQGDQLRESCLKTVVPLLEILSRA